MSVFEVQGGRINRRYLERKTKFDLCSMYLDLLDQFERVKARADLAAEREHKILHVISGVTTDLCIFAESGDTPGADDATEFIYGLAEKLEALTTQPHSREGGEGS